jgi:hypothetical protein
VAMVGTFLCWEVDGSKLGLPWLFVGVRVCQRRCPYGGRFAAVCFGCRVVWEGKHGSLPAGSLDQLSAKQKFVDRSLRWVREPAAMFSALKNLVGSGQSFGFSLDGDPLQQPSESSVWTVSNGKACHELGFPCLFSSSFFPTFV